MQEIVSPLGTYKTGGQLGGTDAFTLYECVLEDGRPAILKIAKSKGLNGVLDREAFVLQTLQDAADKIEEERAASKKSELGYRRFFPRLVENFISTDQGGRRILILDMSYVCEKLSDLAPISRLESRERLRVDPKTSVWILGKLLKLLGFAHYHHVNVRLAKDNVLLNREQHYVVVFDWSSSIVSDSLITRSAANEEISQAALITIGVLGGSERAGTIPKDPDLTDNWYRDLLFSLLLCDEKSADDAHTRFYETVRKRWPSQFHPFRAYPIGQVQTETEN